MLEMDARQRIANFEIAWANVAKGFSRDGFNEFVMHIASGKGVRIKM